MSLSLVMPVLNEGQLIAQTLTTLQPMRARGVELIVVDGASRDDTVAQSQSLADLVLSSKPGRARQMNTGATQAKGDILLFLHADTTLPPNADQLILEALSQPRSNKHAQWGRFDVTISGQHKMLRVIAFMMNWRSRLTHIATGDQALFVTSTLFRSIGGFPDQPLMEDIAISNLLRQQTKPACLHQTVQTSGRRWESRGVWRTIALMWHLRWRYWRGESPKRLAERYR